MKKDEIRNYALHLGADVVGFASVDDYKSEKSPDPKMILPKIQSLIVMGFREIRGAVESEYPRVGMVSRLGSIEIGLNTTYKIARFVEKETNTKAVAIPPTYPIEMSSKTNGTIGDVSLRHAAVAAGLGAFGRHNLVINPKFGTQVLYTAVLSELSFESDPKISNLCNDCGLCVKVCPGHALDGEGKTSIMKCLRNSQPTGLNGVISYLSEMIEKPKEEQLQMIRDPKFWDLYQTSFIGYNYSCFKCMAVCPISNRS